MVGAPVKAPVVAFRDSPAGNDPYCDALKVYPDVPHPPVALANSERSGKVGKVQQRGVTLPPPAGAITVFTGNDKDRVLVVMPPLAPASVPSHRLLHTAAEATDVNG